MNEPKIGCKPYDVVASDRSIELSEAIIRYASDGVYKNHYAIGKRAAEIEWLCAVAGEIYEDS